MTDKKIVIGRIGAPHGVRGELRIVPLTDFPDRFNGLKSVYVDKEAERVPIERVRYQNKFIVMKFAGVNDRDAAGRLTGRLLKVDRQEVPPLPEGEYYNFDIIGLAVYDETDKLLGTIKEILKTGSNDVYVTEDADGVQILVPALKKVVKNIDLTDGKMIVALQEELNDAD